MENNTNNTEKKFLFQKSMKKTDEKNNFLRLKKDDAEIYFGRLREGETKSINFKDKLGELRTIDYSHRKIDKSYAYVLSGENWKIYVRQIGLKKSHTVKFYGHGGDCNLFFIEDSVPLQRPSTTPADSAMEVSRQPENTEVHPSVNPSIQAPYSTESGSVRGAPWTTPTNFPGAFSTRSDNDFAENPSTSRPSEFPSAPVPGSIPGDEVPTFSLPPADQTGMPNSNFDFLNSQDYMLYLVDDHQPNLNLAPDSGIGPPPNVDDDSQTLTNNDAVGRNIQSYFDQYINKCGVGLLNQLNSAQNEHVKPFVLNSVGSIMKILVTNQIGQVHSNDFRSQIDTYWEPITQFNLDLSPLKKLVDDSQANLREFEQTKKQVDDYGKTLEAIEIKIEEESKNIEIAKRRLEEFTKQAVEIKIRIEERKNCMASMRVSPLQSRF
ncbi:DNA-binding pseudobarrel domain containing protein [Parasponia andersonii]|uniref:DNA-binding pseudobarrel domain containing protein n=1 Tax=Parasponia andersonii TaxID=3476 RepID=A0A2P5B4L0_PARAD|nr:DNA-binding pseudobarrel domain containing protein [Parasponia andersonii]